MDNNQDVVVLNANNFGGNGSGYSILLGNGDGTLQTRDSYRLNNRLTTALDLGDVNLDGIPDLFMGPAGSRDDLIVLLGIGDGTFQDVQTLQLDDPAILLDFGGSLLSSSVSRNELIEIDDLNGDGLPDIAVAARSGTRLISIVLGNGDSTFQLHQSLRMDNSRPSSVSTNDFNGDGFLDLATVNRFTDEAAIFLGNGDGSFQAEQVIPVGDQPVSIDSGDINGDGISDLAVANFRGEDVSILIGIGDGTFQSSQTHFWDIPLFSVTLGDINSDDILDIVTGGNSFNAGLSVFLGNGGGTFQLQQTFSGVFPRTIVISDLDGDGMQDIVAVDSSGSTSFLGNGDGTFQPRMHINVNSFSGLAVADLNNDNVLDLVVQSNSENVSVYLGNGDGSFQQPQAFFVGNSPRSIAVIDINGDGNLDIASTIFNSDSISILLGNGDGTFIDQLIFGAGDEPVSIQIADLNADGAPDIVTANERSNDLSVILHR